MKKLIFFFLLFLATFTYGQTIKDLNNSTTASTTPLDSSEVFTGYRYDVTAYNSVTVSMWSDDTATVSVQFGDLINTTFTIQKYWNFTYLANDTTFSKELPIVAPYYRVVVTNAADDSMTVFRLTSMLHKGQAVPIDTNGYISTVLQPSTNVIGKLAANSGVDIGDVDVTSISAGDNNIGNVDIVTLPSITYGNTTLINASQLDDDPTADTSNAFLMGNKNKIGISVNYDETEVGGGVSGTLTLQVSPDSTNWYAFDVILDGNGTDAPNASISYTSDATDYVYLPRFATAVYLRAIFTGTNTDTDDTIVVTVDLYWQAE